MEQFFRFLGYPLITVADQPVTVGQVGIVVAVIVIGYFLARWLERFIVRRLTENRINPDLIHLVRRIYLVLVLAILLLTVLQLLNVPLAAFAFISGAIAIGFGFGAQNIINNFISGWILMWERPIRIGDFLEVGETKGTVEAINTRSTRIRRTDGVHLLIPNSHLLENMVVNWTLVDRLTRALVRVGVAYGSPVRKVAELIDQAANEHDEVLKEPKPMVIFEDFGDNALIFDLYLWVFATADRDLRKIRSDIRFRIDELFREHGITIAFPQRDVHLDNISPVEVRVIERSSQDDKRPE
ncbi:MAG: mechanosensitive ion channel [Gammaproteobacteria bacterium]|nr:mechanosensitive ion channel [Gammaproteobacteria bacterium]